MKLLFLDSAITIVSFFLSFCLLRYVLLECLVLLLVLAFELLSLLYVQPVLLFFEVCYIFRIARLNRKIEKYFQESFFIKVYN